MRIMAIDYGDARTGVAISDPTGLLAGYTTVIQSRKEGVVAEELARLAKEHSVDELVMGFPRNMDGTEGPRAELYRAFAARLDGKMENQTVILVGMVFSLFVNAILTLITALSREHLQQMVFWQMGGFTGRNWSHVAVMFPVLVLSMLVLQRFTPEMDIMSFVEEQAMSIGVDLKRIKLLLIGIAALLTGTAVSMVSRPACTASKVSSRVITLVMEAMGMVWSAFIS